ncbi:MAG: hypothetical protein ACRDTX_16240 [Pseudonocardiaceae bacterium]
MQVREHLLVAGTVTQIALAASVAALAGLAVLGLSRLTLPPMLPPGTRRR